MAKGLFVAVSLLLSFLRGHALEDLRPGATSGSPPPPPVFHCFCSSYPNVTRCSWLEPAHSPAVRYIGTYKERLRPLVTNTFQVPPSETSSSVLDSAASQQMRHFYLPDLKLFTDYIINVTAIDPSNMSSSYLSSFMLEDIVKPDPPVDLRVSPNVRGMLVQWSPPPTWANLGIFPLKYHIRFQWVIRDKPKFVNIGPFDTTSTELRELRPGRPYLVQVCARELLGLGECSDWSEAVRVTIPRAKL